MARDLADELLQAQVKARLFGGDRAVRLGRLVVLDRIGSGAMGSVYAAYDPRLDRRVAVKVLHAADAAANARSLGEARALAKLAHPNVIRIHDAAEEDGAVHIVMELATGTPLRAWIMKERTWRDVVRVMRDAAAGLAAAHAAGVVHRDIKPDNIVVGDDATRVVDFGLAQTDGSDDDWAGTPSYMAPEVLAGAAASTASDQFSFGVTMYEALYGERPHGGATREDLQRAALLASSARPGRPVQSQASPVLATAATELDANRTVASAPDNIVAANTPHGPATQPPSWVHAIVKRALAADPAKRFASMDELVVALSRDRRRTRVILGVAAGALVIGAVGGAAAYRAQSEVHRCDTDRGAQAWSPTRATRIRTSLGDAPWSTAAVNALGSHAQQWDAAYRGVCEATRVRGGQSDRLLELRMRCLDRALDRFEVLAATLEGPLEPGPRMEAAGAIAQLPQPDACRTVVDPAELALPADPAQRDRVLAAERTLDRAWTDFALGRYREARETVVALESTTSNLDADGLQATLATLAAAIESRVGDPTAARARLDRALAATAKARATALEHVVWTRLLRHELFAGTPARAIEWEPFARAAALRAGLDGAELDGIIGEALRDAGQLARARASLNRALASHDPLRKDQRAIIEMNLGSVELAMGQPVLAEGAFQRAFELARAQLGDGHSTLAIYLDKLADADRARGRIASALAHHDRSVALRTATYGEADRSVATARFHRAETLLEAGQLARATTDLEAARAIRAKALGEASPRLGEIEAALGDVELARGRPKEALARYERAAALDRRLDLAARRMAAGENPTVEAIAKPPAIEPFSVERAPLFARLIDYVPELQRGAFAHAVYAAWQAARTEDPTLTLATADALRAAGRRADAEALYRAALRALADEPSRMRLHALRALTDADAKAQADALSRQLPELPPP